MSDILKLFEGLTSEQVREFNGRIVPTLERLRNEITTGEKTMTDDFKLTEQEIQQILAARQKQTTPDEEQQIVDRAAAQAKQQIEQLRTGKVQAALNAEWNREMRGLMNRRASLQEKLEVKAKYQALGLTDFTPREVDNG